MTLDILISQVMNTAPFQLPPISKGNGVYSIDCRYLGGHLNKVGETMEEVMKSYFDFVTKQNWTKGEPQEPLAAAPRRPGAAIYSTDRPYSVVT
jgi:hypothetical protein